MSSYFVRRLARRRGLSHLRAFASNVANRTRGNFDISLKQNRYCPKTTREGATVTEWTDPYEPTPEQEAADRQKAFEAGIPHGEYVYR